MNCPFYDTNLRLPEGQICTNHKPCSPYYDHDAMHSEVFRVKMFIVMGEKCISQTKYIYIFHLSALQPQSTHLIK